MAAPTPVLVVTANLGPDAVPFSGGNAPVTSFAKAVAQSLPGAIVCATVSVPVANNTQVALPASVFAAGSGVYQVFADVAGSTGYDLTSFGSVVITAGAITTCAGFQAQSVQAPVYAAGPPPTVTQITANMAPVGASAAAYIPNHFQTSGGALTYSVTAIKIANYPSVFLPGGTV